MKTKTLMARFIKNQLKNDNAIIEINHGISDGYFIYKTGRYWDNNPLLEITDKVFYKFISNPHDETYKLVIQLDFNNKYNHLNGLIFGASV